MLTLGLCIAGGICLLFVFVCMIFHSAKMSDIEMMKAKEREWLIKGLEKNNAKK